MSAEPRTRRKGGKKSIWDAQLDARLLEIIEEEDANAKKDREANGANGAHTTQRNWKRIAQKLGEGDAFGRRQCQERFVNHINPAAEERQVSQEESKILCELFQLPEYGRNWSKLSQEIHRRDPSKKPHVPLTLKNRFWSSVRKARRCLARKKPLTPKLTHDIDNDPVLNYFYYHEDKLPPQTTVNKRKQSSLAGARRNKKRRAGDLKDEHLHGISPVLLHGVVGADHDHLHAAAAAAHAASAAGLTPEQFADLQRMKLGMSPAAAAAAHDMAIRQLAIQRFQAQSHDVNQYLFPPPAHPSSRDDPQQQARFALDSMKLNSANVPTFSQAASPPPPHAASTVAFQQQMRVHAAAAAQQQAAAAAGMFTPMPTFAPFNMFGSPAMFMPPGAAAAAAAAVMSSAAAHQPSTTSVDSYSSASSTHSQHPSSRDSPTISPPRDPPSTAGPSLAGALAKHLAEGPSSSLPGHMHCDSSAISTMAAMGLAPGADSSQMMQMLGAAHATNAFYGSHMDVFKRYMNGPGMANPFKGGSGANVGNSMLSPESPRELNDAAMRIAINAAAAVRPPRTGPGGGARSPTAADHGVNGVADPSILRHGPVVGGGVPPDTKPRLAGIAAN